MWHSGDRVRTFPRTIDGKDVSFDDEKSLPRLNNLSTHIKDCKRTKDAENNNDTSTPPLTERVNLKRSAELMEGYLKQGELNPALVPTQKGFLRLFAAWILDESLPWTTGEAPSLSILFQYLKIRFVLPTDTTVRNQLAHIFSELHGKVVREFSVRRACNFCKSN